MENQHQRHLFATYLALLQLGEEIRTLATRGATPGGAARRLPTLPAEEWSGIERDLDAVLAIARAGIARHAPELLAGHERGASVVATRRWIALLLGRGTDLATEFEPERMARRFGPIAESETADLRALTTELRDGVGRLLATCQEKS
jgi:hypothetical protein